MGGPFPCRAAHPLSAQEASCAGRELLAASPSPGTGTPEGSPTGGQGSEWILESSREERRAADQGSRLLDLELGGHRWLPEAQGPASLGAVLGPVGLHKPQLLPVAGQWSPVQTSGGLVLVFEDLPPEALGPLCEGFCIFCFSWIKLGTGGRIRLEDAWDECVLGHSPVGQLQPWDLGSHPGLSLEAGNAWCHWGAEVLLPMDQNVPGLRLVSIRGTARTRASSLGEAHTATVQPGPARAAPCPLHSQSPSAGAEPGSRAWLLGENTGGSGRRAWEATCRKRLPDRARLALPLAPSPTSSGF